MITKKKNNTILYLKFFLFFVFIVLIYFFRTSVVNYFFFVEQKYFSTKQNQTLILSEREELQNLQTENIALKQQIKNLKEAFSDGDYEEKHFPVFMLTTGSDFYGDFYVSIPKENTPYLGMNILSTGNVLVGTVSEILPNSLKVNRLGQTKTFIATNSDGSETVELGSLSSGLYVGTVPGGSKLAVGDQIALKGYPKVIVGTVVEIQKNDTSLANIFVRAPYNINDKEIFYVLK